MSYFTIQNISVSHHDSGFGGYRWKLEVRVDVDKTEWHALKKKNQLGQLYGIDVGNALFRSGYDKHGYSVPQIDDKPRCKGNIKSIGYTVLFNSDEAAEAYGIKFKDFSYDLGNGQKHRATADFHPYVVCYSRQELKVG